MSYPVEELLPHDHPMILLDRVLDWNQDGDISAEVIIGPQTPFLDPGKGIPAHVGLEWMAQCCGLFAGLEAKAKNKPVGVGFLLGTRRYKAAQPWFVEGERLTVSGKLVLREGGMAVFDCRIQNNVGEEAASAQLTLYQPEDAGSVLATSSMV